MKSQRHIDAAEDPTAPGRGPATAEIGARIGALIRQGRPLPAVLTTLCQLFDVRVKGCFSSVLLLDEAGVTVRMAIGPGLPASYLKQLEGRRVSWLEAPCRAAPGLRLHAASRVRSLTGESLGVFAVHQRDSQTDLAHLYSTLLPRFTYVAGAVIERMRSDAALARSAALLERTQQLSSTCGFCWYVETGEISGSSQLCQLFGLDPAVLPLTLERIRARIHSEALPSFHEMIERAHDGVGELEFEHRLRLPDDSVRHLRIWARRTGGQAGHLEYLGAAQDVTHRRRAEEALVKLRAELVRATRVTSLGVLTAAIAHEVNQPLAGIVTNASTCRRMLAVDPPDIEGARETARRTIRDAERASEVVKRLRALFCKKDVTSEPVDLNEATLEVVALSLSELERNKVTVRTELAGQLPPVQGDRVQLQQVILNLFLNAADAMSGVNDRPRQLLIRTERDAQDRVHMSVRDTGVGLEPQAADKLFDAFYTTKSGGMGIGLSVSRCIIESHKGRLWAAPNEGPGATFAFVIPCGPQGLSP
jgi:signal transduction histidine kinase